MARGELHSPRGPTSTCMVRRTDPGAAGRHVPERGARCRRCARGHGLTLPFTPRSPTPVSGFSGTAGRVGPPPTRRRNEGDGPSGTKGGDRRRGAVGLRPGGRQVGVRAPPPGHEPGPGRRGRRPRDEVDGFMSHGTGALPAHRAGRVPGHGQPHRLHRLHRRGRLVLGDVPRARRGRHRPGPDRHRPALLRVDLAGRPQAPVPNGQPLLREQGPDPVRRPLRPHPHRQARHVGPSPHARVRHDHRAAGRDRRLGPLQRRASTPTPTTATPSPSRTSSPRR